MGPGIQQNGANFLPDLGASRFSSYEHLDAESAQRVGEAAELGAFAASVQAFERDELASAALIVHGSNHNIALALCRRETVRWLPLFLAGY